MKDIIINYAKNITESDISNFAHKKNINITSSELIFIKNYIQNNYLDIMNNHINYDLIKKNLSSNNYQEIIKLLNEYQKYLL